MVSRPWVDRGRLGSPAAIQPVVGVHSTAGAPQVPARTKLSHCRGLETQGLRQRRLKEVEEKKNKTRRKV